MRFYNRHHQSYCGIDLHVKTTYVCILDGTGVNIAKEKTQTNMRASTAGEAIRIVAPLAVKGWR